MTTSPLVRPPARVVATPAFAVVWQDPLTRSFIRVGVLEVLPDGRHRYRYEQGARSSGFDGFLAFPDRDGVYESAELPPFFRNRVLSARRPDYPRYIERLGLGPDAEPIEILARSGGGRATDTVHVVPLPAPRADGAVQLRFLASGVRHADPDGTHLAGLSNGDRLTLVDQPDNAHNARAILLDSATGQDVGWVPDYLVETVHELRGDRRCDVYAERVNGPDAPAHLRLLCVLVGE